MTSVLQVTFTYCFWRMRILYSLSNPVHLFPTLCSVAQQQLDGKCTDTISVAIV